MNGLLLTSSKDIYMLKSNINLAGIACFYPIIQENDSIKLEYLFDSSLDTIDYNLVGSLASNWYRDGQGVDIISAPGVAIGPTLQSNLLIEISNVMRYYFAFEKYSNKYDKILVSENIPKSLSIVLQLFSNKIDFFYSDNIYEPHITVSPVTVVEPPPVHEYFSTLLRFIQDFFPKHFKSKVLVINDWTYRKIKNPNCLNINRFNPLRTFCLVNSKKNFESLEYKFQKKLDSNLIDRNINRVLESFDFNGKIKSDLTSICIQVIEKKYKESRDNLVKIYCSYQEMFEYYSPSMIIVPGYAHPFYQTIYEIARSKRIPTLMIQDGYSFYFDKHNFPKNRGGDRQTFDYCATMGGDVDKIYKNIFSALPVKTLRIFPPVVMTHGSSSQDNESDEVIIMFPHGMLYSPNCMWDQRYKYVLDVIGMLRSLNIFKIKVKIKDGDNSNKNLELKLMKNLIDKYGYSNVEFISGKLSKYLDSSKFIVGYLGTAIIESIYRKVPFYVYEPKILGMSDDFISNATILNDKQISRNISDLKTSIIDRNHVKLNEKDIFSGIHIKDIDYLNIIENFQRKR
jgi:hypothetical protein